MRRLFPCAVALACLARSADGQPTDTAPAPPVITEQRVESAIQKAVSWLKSKRKAGGDWEQIDSITDRHWGGETALVVLSLLYAGVDPETEPWLAESIDWVDRQGLNGVYAMACRAHMLALLRGEKWHKSLERDLNWLLSAAWPATSLTAGAYDYVPPPPGAQSGRWDNSATQFGNLGVWMAAEAGLDVPNAYWEMVGNHWVQSQDMDGGWAYQSSLGGNSDTPSSGSMTAAGLASLFVVLDYRYADAPKAASRILSAIDRGMTWMGKNFTPLNPMGGDRWRYYFLYGVERVARASGYRYFGTHDWLREGGGYILDHQKPDGSWASTDREMSDQRNTAFALMFLCHSRAPLVFNKLERQIGAADRTRDVAGLTHYGSYALERLLNWQIVNLTNAPEDLLEAPVLFYYSRSAADFDDDEVDRIRTYCQRGGLFFVVSGDAKGSFRKSFESLAKRAFPDYPPKALPDDHPLFNGEIQFRIPNPPTVLGVDNGVRSLMMFCTRDIAQSWARYASRNRNEADLNLGVNLYLYACDKSPQRSRLENSQIPLIEKEAERTVYLGRVQYDGRWDVESQGWLRFSRYMSNEVSTRILLMSGLTLAGPAPPELKIAHLTGNEAFTFSEAERSGLRRFLYAGGTLIVDAAGGSRAFVRAFEEEMRTVLRDEPRPVPASSFLITGKGIPGGVDVSKVGLRRAALATAGGRSIPLLETYGNNQRFTVIVSPLDLSAGLLGTPIYNVQGYDPKSTLEILRNLVLYANLSAAEKAELHRGQGG